MKTTIQNEFLKVKINHKGAELGSIDKDGQNHIWEINPNFWDKTSPILFPIVGGLKNNSFEFDGKKYELPRHGFAREKEFELVSKTENSAKFSLKYNEETLQIYPFKFTLNIEYQLSLNQLIIKYTVINTSSDKMYFSIGAHPAFSIDGDIENYSLAFDNSTELTSYKLRDNLFSGETKKIPLNGKILPLNYSLFAEDAIVLKNSETSSLTLLKNDIPQLKVSFPDFPYLGIWTKKEAPFICIEPWLGIADHHDASGKIKEKEGIQILEGDSEMSVEWSVEIF